MKVLQVIQYLSAAKGGSVTHVYNLTKYLIQHGHQVTILTTRDGFDPVYAASLAPAEVIALPSYLGSLRYSPDINRYLEKEIHSLVRRCYFTHYGEPDLSDDLSHQRSF